MLDSSTSANRYRELRERTRVKERALFATPRNPNELELQARWFAGDFGRRFRAASGEEIEIVQFGIWNREAGPDFHNAAIRVGDEVRRGSIEFDLSDRSWEAHGHSINRAFEDTVLHVFVNASEHTFFTRTRSNRNVLQVRVDLGSLPDAFASNVPLARPGRCHAPLQGLPEDRVQSVLEAASRFRLERKAARLRALAENHGRNDAVFQELATALGYKQNKLPFTLIAQRLPLAVLRGEGARAEALLFGIAGFLDAPDLAGYESDTRSYVRSLWDQWWSSRDAMQRLALPQKLWRLSGARPLNHPQRRLGALAAVVREWHALEKALASAEPAAAIRRLLLELEHPFWQHHYTLISDAAAKQMALIGETRIAEIMANVVFPWLAAQGADTWRDYHKLPAKLTNRRLETAVTRLFGDDPRQRAFVRTVVNQQGLLQIYEDFCLQDNSDCAHCPFPEQMQKWTA